MKRFPWDILITIILGLGLGLAYGWLFAPLNIVDTTPRTLRADFKDQYRSAIAASFAATGNLPRAEARLALLGDADPIAALNSQAQRLIASGANGEFSQAEQLAILAMALQNGFVELPVPSPTAQTIVNSDTPPTSTQPPTPQQDFVFQVTETPLVETPFSATQPAIIIPPTPRPTRTPVPTVGAPFALIAQDTVCDSNLPDGLLQVTLFNSSRRQVAGAQIIIFWLNGEDQFFTGHKPEIGNGYADFIMTPGVTYSVRLAAGSDLVTALSAPTCQAENGESFLGGIKLTFQQP